MSRIRIAAVSPLLLVALACDKGEPRTTTVAASVATTADSNRPSDTSSVPVGSRPFSPSPVSYEDAEKAFKAGHYADATELFAAYVESKPDNPWGRYMLGLSAWKSGDLARAQQAFDEALTLDPTHLKSMLNSTRVLLERGKNAEAMERITTALETAPQSAEAVRLHGRTLAQVGRNEEAIAAYQRAAALDEHDVWAMNNLGVLYIQLGRYAEALPPLARATEIRPGSPVFQNNLGQALERLGHYAQARKAYESAVAADSSYVNASTGLARLADLEQPEGVSPPDLKVMADEFRAAVQQWAFVARDTAPDVSDSVEIQ